MNKTCSACGLSKRNGHFQKRAASNDGLTAACRLCLRKRDAARYPKERKYRLAQHQIYMKTARGKQAHSKAAAKWREENKLARAAHLILASAVRSEKVKRMPCEKCASKRSHAHHDDYSKPLEVRWLCSKHHTEIHA